MSSLGLQLSQPVGFLDFENVWLDDRMRCRWGLEGFDLVALPGQTVVVLDDEPDGRVAHDVLDLVSGRRSAVRGTVSLDGISLADLAAESRDAAITELASLSGGDHVHGQPETATPGGVVPPPGRGAWRRGPIREEGGERRVVVAGRTTLVADPRPLTLLAADHVVVIAHGTTVAAGSHRQLMLAGGRYAHRFGEVTAA